MQKTSTGFASIHCSANATGTQISIHLISAQLRCLRKAGMNPATRRLTNPR
jgi:hypothetical protein